jgi:KTSC domain
MNEIPLHSSVLSGFRYDPDRQQLWLRFRAGDLYVYQMVPATVIQALIEAPSHGQYFNSAIRGRFSCRRLS